MVDDSKSDPAAGIKADIASSHACTQSGAFALLLSVALFLLIPYWIQQPIRIALARYVTYRNNLVLRFEQLDDDPYWQKYKDSHPSADSMSISQLLKVSVEGGYPDHAAPVRAQPKHSTVPKTTHRQFANRASGPPVPAPPTFLRARVTTEIAEMRPIADYLVKLNDPEMLTKARMFSNYFSLSVARWGQKRSDMVYRNAINNGCYKQELEIKRTGTERDFFVPELKKEALLKCLTLGNVHELVEFELPKMSNPTQLGGRIGGRVDITPGTLPHDPYTASIVVQGLLFFVIMYFAAFAHEAVSSPSFPAQGTLFRAFASSRKTLFVFLIALWTPVLASLSVAYLSRTWSIAACSPCLLLAVLLAHRMLCRKSYFRPLYRWKDGTFR